MPAGRNSTSASKYCVRTKYVSGQFYMADVLSEYDGRYQDEVRSIFVSRCVMSHQYYDTQTVGGCAGAIRTMVVSPLLVKLTD